MSDHISDIFIIPSQAIHPPDHKVITVAEFVEQPFALGTITQPVLNAGNTMISNNFINCETRLPRLVYLMVE